MCIHKNNRLKMRFFVDVLETGGVVHEITTAKMEKSFRKKK